jgi:hypothetical protein
MSTRVESGDEAFIGSGDEPDHGRAPMVAAIDRALRAARASAREREPTATPFGPYLSALLPEAAHGR